MNKGGIGVGSASVVLIFAVLCLTVFALITFVVAGNNKALIDTEAQLVTAYYEADVLAERVLAEILESVFIPDSVLGVDIETSWEWELDTELVYYACPISDSKELFVKLAINYDSYDVLSWHMRDIGDWTIDDSLNVWLGPDFFDDFDDPLNVWLGLDQWDFDD